MIRAGALTLLVLGASCGTGWGGAAPSGDGKTVSDPWARWFGCYALSPVSEGWRIPQAVALDPDSLGGWEEFAARFDRILRARSFERRSSSSRDTPFGYWRSPDEGSVVASHPGALAGLILRIQRKGGELWGVAVAFDDLMPSEGSGRDSTAVNVRRIPCEALGPTGT